MEIKSRIIDYMESNKADIDRISRETGIALDRFVRDSGSEITADELCRLCVYLNVRPEDFYTRKIKP